MSVSNIFLDKFGKESADWNRNHIDKTYYQLFEVKKRKEII